jgi:glucose/arabinose dehydrogenase
MHVPGQRTCAGVSFCIVLAAALSALPQPVLGQALKSGYALNEERCGAGALAFPKLRITMRPGYCAGLVASKPDGLIFPRTIAPVPDTRFLVVADMGGWDPKKGRVLLLDPEAPEGQRLKVLLRGLDLPHGLAVGIDKRVYVGVVDKIFRFDPLAADPATSVETILQGLPGFQPVLADGTRLKRNSHPLKHFVFDRTGRIFVNIGAPSDACATSKNETKPCAAGEGASPLAAVWMFTPPAGGIFPALRPGDANPKHEVYGRGLRNAMALAVHPRFPDPGFALLQGENARDIPDAVKPNEEINVLEPGKHYGWPYCHDLATVGTEYAAFLKTSPAYRNLCANTALYRRPHTVMPPHGAPLGMLYYHGEKFAGLKDKLLVALHGYRPSGSRVLVYDTDAHGLPPVGAPPVRYNVSCAASEVFAENGKPIPAAPYVELISGWHRVNGVRPQGAPVGMAVAADGAIWLVEDKNQAIIRVDAEPESAAVGALPCGTRTPAQIASLADRVMKDAGNRTRLTQIRAQLIERRCIGCHADFDIKRGMNEAQKDTAVLRFLLAQDGWIFPGNPEGGRLHNRVWGKGAEKVMPADGRELMANDPGYKALLMTLDAFVAKIPR